jgi:hypothetical protein
MLTWLRLLTNLRGVFLEVETRLVSVDFALEQQGDELESQLVAQRVIMDNFATQLLDAAKEEHCKLELRVRELEGMLRSKKIDRRKGFIARRRKGAHARRRKDREAA